MMLDRELARLIAALESLDDSPLGAALGGLALLVVLIGTLLLAEGLQ